MEYIFSVWIRKTLLIYIRYYYIRIFIILYMKKIVERFSIWKFLVYIFQYKILFEIQIQVYMN